MAVLLASLHQGFRIKLVFQELIRCALIDQQEQSLIGFWNQQGGIPFFPLRRVVTKIALECFLPPRAPSGMSNGREGRYGGIAARISECAYQCTMATHGVPADATPVG